MSEHLGFLNVEKTIHFREGDLLLFQILRLISCEAFGSSSSGYLRSSWVARCKRGHLKGFQTSRQRPHALSLYQPCRDQSPPTPRLARNARETQPTRALANSSWQQQWFEISSSPPGPTTKHTSKKKQRSNGRDREESLGLLLGTPCGYPTPWRRRSRRRTSRRLWGVALG